MAEASHRRVRLRPLTTRPLARAGLCLIPLLSLEPASAAPRPFEHLLTRSISVKGELEGTFSLAERMAHYRVPGISVAVIEGCRIVDARGFGFSAGGGPPISPRTLFQAGSISKSVTAVAALRLVDRQQLSLDTDVRAFLRSWRLPESPLLSNAPVTLRRLLNHTAGLNAVSGKGYLPDAPVPTLLQILNGTPPANTARIRLERAPGSTWVYSGGGYYIAQALMTDVTGVPFPDLAERLVFRRAGMLESSFAQPLNARQARRAARAVGPDGSPLRGGWRVNPELAGGGLWSTPTDLARFAIAVAKAVRGERGALLSGENAGQLMTRGLRNWGLGVDLGPTGGPRRFGHTGHTVGFVSEFVMYPESCQGAVVMTNADQGGWLATEVLRAIGDAYSWPGRQPRPVHAAVPLTDEIAGRFIGAYRLRDFPSERFTVSRTPPGGLYWARVGHVGRDLLAEDTHLLFSPDSKMSLRAIGDATPRAATLELSFGGGTNVADRIE